jgi:hypothetical protein
MNEFNQQAVHSAFETHTNLTAIDFGDFNLQLAEIFSISGAEIATFDRSTSFLRARTSSSFCLSLPYAQAESSKIGLPNNQNGQLVDFRVVAEKYSTTVKLLIGGSTQSSL